MARVWRVRRVPALWRQPYNNILIFINIHTHIIYNGIDEIERGRVVERGLLKGTHTWRLSDYAPALRCYAATVVLCVGYACSTCATAYYSSHATLPMQISGTYVIIMFYWLFFLLLWVGDEVRLIVTVLFSHIIN